MRVLILGASGGFGGLIGSLLSSEGHSITGVDVAPPAERSAGRFTGFVLADAAAPERPVLSLAAECDWIVSCMHQSATLPAFDRLAPQMKRGSLFMDVLSVKTPICSRMESARPDIECLSIHPMFAPSVGFSRQNVAVVRVRGGRHADAVESLLRKWGSRIHRLSAEQHDRATTAIQAATHAAIISFGTALSSMGYDLSGTLPISSPPHRILLAMLARIACGNPGVYWQVQAENPFAEAARSEIVAGAARFQQLASSGSQEEFSALMSSLADLLAPAREDLLELASRALSIPLSPSE